LLSVPRDLLVEVEPGVKDRINTAYLDGGTQRATAVMEDLTGITIDRHAIVDFGGFEDVIDAIGSVRHVELILLLGEAVQPSAVFVDEQDVSG
jgi:polyisoprenyl-teichoic acid--peptidoglycan teichoic acid transferase